ncbi:MAG: hydantoinase/oxoprolinase family protein, partial [Candidatus Methanomethylophilaceae archaeon]|nr:hydantoinase/oxoprolinase family protein [Candidatus Methanomethylophilaceae archaeon]
SDYRVIAKAKSPTTHRDLSVGLFQSIRKVFDEGTVKPSEISLAGISTTLATNSVLEGNGGSVGLILIGWRDREAKGFGEKHLAHVKGGFNSKGQMIHALDMEEVKEAILKVSEGVDAIAISGLFAVLNPTQETAVKKLAQEMTGLPTVAGTELSSILGVDERARTAVLNGRLISVIGKFFDGLERTFREMGITAPIMVYKGDGSVMGIDKARTYPVESVFSGPAASSVGGRIISGMDDFIMVDIGGTATDIAIVDGGMPEICEDGANIRGWRTHVKAVDMFTVALGGDSLIKLKDPTVDLGNGVVIPFFSLSRFKSFNFNIGPERVIPLSKFCVDSPEIIPRIKDSWVSDYYRFVAEPDPSLVTDRCMRVANTLKERGALSLIELREGTKGLWTIDDEVRTLMDLGYIEHGGLTPSDLMVLRGQFENGDPEGSRAGVYALSQALRMKEDDVIERLMDMVHAKIAEAVLVRLMDDRYGIWKSNESLKIVRDMASIKPEKGFAVMPRIEMPIVCIGAPTKSMMGDVGKRLGTELIFPENGDVGNAIGAVCSKMVASLTAEITPTDDGHFRVVVPLKGQRYMSNLETSIATAKTMLEDALVSSLRKDGALNVKVYFKVRIASMTDDGFWTEDDLDHADVIARAIGDPKGL